MRDIIDNIVYVFVFFSSSFILGFFFSFLFVLFYVVERFSWPSFRRYDCTEKRYRKKIGGTGKEKKGPEI